MSAREIIRRAIPVGFHTPAEGIDTAGAILAALTAAGYRIVGPGKMLEARLVCAWTDFLDANPDDLNSPEDLPGHALMTGDQFVQYALRALAKEAK